MPITVKALSTTRLHSVSIIEDTEAGRLLCYFPVDMEGEDDATREVMFLGETSIKFPNHPPITIRFPVPGNSIPIALQQWHKACSNAVVQWEADQRKQEIANAGASLPKIHLPS